MRKLGPLLIVLGLLLITGALSLHLRNQAEQNRAALASQTVIPKVVEAIEQRQFQSPAEEKKEPEPERLMPVTKIDGYDYIGFLSIPSLELELPVMSQWSTSQLQIAPCRFSGTTYGNDLVLMAHNYDRHFGPLMDLRPGERLSFTDMDGVTVEYDVTVLDILEPTAVEEMTAGDYDLTLFTCTYGGHSRVTVRCNRIG